MKLVIKNKEEIAKSVAQIIVDEVKNNPKCVLGLATGSTPLDTYKKVIEISKLDKVSFKEVTTFNLDEYVGLDEKNDQSYRYFMNENLFKHLDFNRLNHHFPLIDNYEKYDDLILQHGGIDIQILGIGSNGHIAFNEPGTSFESLTHITKLASSTIKDNSRFFNSIDDVPKEAITMGLKSIIQARKIILIATGKNKREAVKKLLSGEIDISCPATILNTSLNEVLVFVDEEALG